MFSNNYMDVSQPTVQTGLVTGEAMVNIDLAPQAAHFYTEYRTRRRLLWISPRKIRYSDTDGGMHLMLWDA